MNNRQELLGLILNQPIPSQVFRAEVLEVTGNWCKVRLLHSDLEVEGVSLVGEEDAGDRVVLQPKVGSLVLVGLIENDLGSLYVAQCGEVDGGVIEIGETKIVFNKSEVSLVNKSSKVLVSQDKAAISRDGVVVECKNGKVSVTNGTITLKTLFDDLATLLNSFIVLTSQGPSTGLSPTSITAITSLKTKVSQLLS